MRRRRWAAAIVVTAGVAIACGTYGSSSSPDVPVDAGGSDDDAHPDASAADATGDADAATDGAPPCAEAGSDPTTSCYGQACAVTSNMFCCLDDGCDEAGSPCTHRVLCDDSADCAARGKTCSICCATSENSHVANSYCAPSCNPGEDQLCDPLGTDCPAGKTCRPSSDVSPYYACQ